jgi:hypothetical protein
MAPYHTSVIISSNTPGIGYKIIESEGITNTQIIVSKTINGERFTYNFNGDVEEGTMELTHGMNALFDLPRGSYKRVIAPDCSYINIVPDGEIEPPVRVRAAWVNNTETINTNDVFAIVEN